MTIPHEEGQRLDAWIDAHRPPVGNIHAAVWLHHIFMFWQALEQSFSKADLRVIGQYMTSQLAMPIYSTQIVTADGILAMRLRHNLTSWCISVKAPSRIAYWTAGCFDPLEVADPLYFPDFAQAGWLFRPLAIDQQKFTVVLKEPKGSNRRWVPVGSSSGEFNLLVRFFVELRSRMLF